MEKLLEKLSEHFGYAAPLMYAGAAYGFFHWLDENASDDAKLALARAMKFKSYKNEQVASALVEIFDRIYSYPLLRWRAFARSLLFSAVISAIYLFETDTWIWSWVNGLNILAMQLLLFNVLTDYLSLFVIRPLLIRSGSKPVTGLVLGALSGAAIVLTGNALRILLLIILYTGPGQTFSDVVDLFLKIGPPKTFDDLSLAWPAMAVFIWLPMFAFGILTIRILTPLSLIVAKTQWLLKEGNKHPLKAIGYVAAVVTFFGWATAQAVFGKA